MNQAGLGTGPKLAIVAVALGGLALFSSPQRGPFVTLDTRELGLIVEQEVDHVTPAELAAWIVAGRADYRLIDLRSPEEYAAYHIPTAENVATPALPDYGLSPRETIVLYSGGGIHSAQAWFLMRAKGYAGTYILFGGLDGWTEEVLYPEAPADADPRARARFEQAAATARFFGGEPRVAGGVASPVEPALPRLAAPTAPAVMPAAPRGKKREGC